MTKALTLHQPWATLIALGVKSIETRGWSTSYRGRLLIHAGKALPTPRWGLLGGYHYDMTARADAGLIWTQAIDSPCASAPLGAIVASCTLADVVPIVSGSSAHEPTPAVWDDDGEVWWQPTAEWGPREYDPRETGRAESSAYGDFAPGRFAWLLEDVAPTTERCPACLAREERWGATSNRAALANLRCVWCNGSNGCDPVPAKGRMGLWEWAP